MLAFIRVENFFHFFAGKTFGDGCHRQNIAVQAHSHAHFSDGAHTIFAHAFAHKNFGIRSKFAHAALQKLENIALFRQYEFGVLRKIFVKKRADIVLAVPVAKVPGNKSVVQYIEFFVAVTSLDFCKNALILAL